MHSFNTISNYSTCVRKIGKKYSQMPIKDAAKWVEIQSPIQSPILLKLTYQWREILTSEGTLGKDLYENYTFIFIDNSSPTEDFININCKCIEIFKFGDKKVFLVQIKWCLQIQYRLIRANYGSNYEHYNLHGSTNGLFFSEKLNLTPRLRKKSFWKWQRNEEYCKMIR